MKKNILNPTLCLAATLLAALALASCEPYRNDDNPVEYPDVDLPEPPPPDPPAPPEEKYTTAI
jgi:hypothetical protein